MKVTKPLRVAEDLLHLIGTVEKFTFKKTLSAQSKHEERCAKLVEMLSKVWRLRQMLQVTSTLLAFVATKKPLSQLWKLEQV